MSEIEIRGKKVSHNLVNSLYVIKGIAESHLESMRRVHETDGINSQELLERATHALSQTMVQANRVIEMIQHFRSVLTVSGNKPGVEKSASVQSAVREVLHAMEYEFPFRRITILKILPHDLPPIPVEREHLETILFHLIYNARQALGSSSGMITVEAGEKFYLSSENKHCRRFLFRVSDTGPGIPWNLLPNIFDPFFTSKNSKDGNGLGLYLVKKIVELYGGSVRVESSPRGASFYVEIPGGQ